MFLTHGLVVFFVGVVVTLQGCSKGSVPTDAPTTTTEIKVTTTTTATSRTATSTTTTTTTTSRTATSTTTTHVPSPFQKYIHDYPDACKPRLFRSTCSDAQYKGIVLFLHGYSACADQTEGLALLLNGHCLDLAAPTMPGHGKAPIHDCNASGANCTVRWQGEGGNMGFDLSDVPTHSSQYFDYADSMVQLVQREHEYRAKKLKKSASQLQLSIGGLSTGGALAAYATSKNPGVFSHMLLIDPYFGAGQAAMDEKMRYSAPSRTAEASVLLTMMPTLAVASDFPELALAGTNDKTLHKEIAQSQDGVTAWDADCWNIFNNGRMGFCAFQDKYGAAAHSVGMHALVQSIAEPASSFPPSQIITTEQDGMTNNGWTYSLGKHIYAGDKNNVAMCMYRFKPGVDRSDPSQYYNSDNVVPHANIDIHDNPNGMWWKDSLFGQIVNFFSGSSVIHMPQKWDKTREQCVGLDFGPFAFGFLGFGSWLNEAVLTGTTPSASDLGPDGLETLLNFDDKVRIPCHTPLAKDVLSGFVDCAALGK